jgi:hypothetical protein
MGPKGTVIVFFALETGEVTYCKTQLIELQGRVKELRTNGLGLAAISYDSPAILEAFRRQHAITRCRSYPTRVQQPSNDTAFFIRLPKRLGDPTATVQWSNPISKNMYRPCVGLNVPSAWLLAGFQVIMYGRF